MVIKSVFITGATGFVGSVVTDELLQHGYSVTGLARSDASAAQLEKKGAKVLRGSLEDIDILKKGAKENNAVLHLGFIHQFDKHDWALGVDRAAIEAILEEFEGTSKVFINTSGTLLNLAIDLGPFAKRKANSDYALSFVKKGIHVIDLRLPPSVHGAGDHGFIPSLIATAREKKISKYFGDGSSVWPAIHRLDAAVIYRLALEKAESGAKIDAVADEGVSNKAIAEAFARQLDIPVESVPTEQAVEWFGFFGIPFSLDNPTSSAGAKALGWTPTQVGLVEDIDSETYFPK